LRVLQDIREDLHSLGNIVLENLSIVNSLLS
jgi:hypothetical protein